MHSRSNPSTPERRPSSRRWTEPGIAICLALVALLGTVLVATTGGLTPKGGDGLPARDRSPSAGDRRRGTAPPARSAPDGDAPAPAAREASAPELAAGPYDDWAVSPREVIKQLVPMRTIRGRILRADGEPVRDAAVTFLRVTGNHSWSRLSGRVAADGSFEVPDVPLKWLTQSLKIEAGAAGFLTETYTIPGTSLEGAGPSIVLRPPIHVRGRFVDEAGKPVAGSHIHGFYGPYNSISAKSDDEGRFDFVAPALRGGALHVDHRGAPSGILRWPSRTASDVDLGDVVVVSGRPIRGRVVGTDGRPISGAEIRVYSAEKWGTQVAKLRTGADGRFALANLGAGLHEVFTLSQFVIEGRAVARGARVVGLVAGAEPVVLTPRPLTRLTVRYLDAVTRKPTELVCGQVQVRRAGAAESQVSIRHDRNCRGSMTVFVEAPGVFDIRVASVHHQATRVTGVRVEAGEDRVLDVDMRTREDS